MCVWGGAARWQEGVRDAKWREGGREERREKKGRD